MSSSDCRGSLGCSGKDEACFQGGSSCFAPRESPASPGPVLSDLLSAEDWRRLRPVVEEVVEILVLENLHIPSFAKRRLVRLAEVWNEIFYSGR